MFYLHIKIISILQDVFTLKTELMGSLMESHIYFTHQQEIQFVIDIGMLDLITSCKQLNFSYSIELIKKKKGTTSSLYYYESSNLCRTCLTQLIHTMSLVFTQYPILIKQVHSQLIDQEVFGRSFLTATFNQKFIHRSKQLSEHNI